MKIKQKQELHNKSVPELTLSLQEAREKLMDLRLERAQKKLKDTRSIFTTRKMVAILATILKERNQPMPEVSK